MHRQVYIQTLETRRDIKLKGSDGEKSRNNKTNKQNNTFDIAEIYRMILKFSLKNI